MTFEQFVAKRFNELNGPLFVWDMLTDADKERWRVSLSTAYAVYKFGCGLRKERYDDDECSRQ